MRDGQLVERNGQGNLIRTSCLFGAEGDKKYMGRSLGSGTPT